MNPKQFLVIGGAVLVLVGVLGFVGIIGPTPEQSLLGATWWFDNTENWAHLILGVVGLVVGFACPCQTTMKWLVAVLGVAGVVIGLWGFAVPETAPNFYGANLENPADNILHLVVGAWALYAAFMGKDMEMAKGQ